MACAQRAYVGANLTLLTDGYYTSPLFGVQVGGSLLPGLELRGAFETVVLGSSLSADLLYRVGPFGPLEGYVGAGPEVLFAPTAAVLPAQVTPLGTPNAGLHGTVGLELRTGALGFFGELQPILTLGPPRLGYTKFRTGVNLHF